VGVNEKPAVSFIAPADDTNFMVGDDVTVNVEASDVDGTVNSVKLYINDTLIRSISDAPYTWGDSLSNDTLLQNLLEGVYTLRAVVEDNELSANSSEITILVGEVETGPTISFTTPADGSEYTVADSIVVNAVASDPNGEIANVKLYIDDVFIRQEVVAPYDWGHRVDLDPALKNMAPGTYSLKVVAEDNDGETSFDEISITIINTTSTTFISTPRMSIRPNVAQNRVHLHLPPQLLNKTYYVFDAMGKLYKTRQTQQAVEVLKVDDLPSGMYFIVLNGVSYRFVKF